MNMSIETISTQITPVWGNVFADLGFDAENVAALQAKSKQVIAEKLVVRGRLIAEICKNADEMPEASDSEHPQ